MAITQLINFISGATRLAKLDTTTAFPGEAPEQLQYHRILVRAGKVGVIVGVIFGVWMSYELYLHPESPDPNGQSIMMTFVVAPLIMVIVGMLGGVSWTGLFVPGTFFSGSVGVHWMKLCGTKGPKSTRLAAAITALLTTGVFIFSPICVWLGKI
jgi:uncharacterized membrane protein